MRVIEIARWAAHLDLADIPDSVQRLCRAQRRSVLAAVAASANDGASNRVLDAVSGWAADGPAPLVGTGRTARVEDSLFLACAWSIALDFDDYVCFGHTGHSAVLLPLLLSAETGSSGTDQLVAQVIANEIGARLGGACLLGPLNGQLWSFIHTGSAALAAGRLLGLDEHQLAHAFAIALTNAPRPTIAGFMAPDTKLLTASEPAVAGLRAARLAGRGVTGPLDVLDHHQGFLEAFSFAPLPSMLGRLGESWATETLSIKPYPGCAYLDTSLDALAEIGPLDPTAVESVTVRAGLLTCGMNSMSADYGTEPTPVTVTFSVQLNVAVHLLAGELTPSQVNEGWLAAHRQEVRELAEKVNLVHDWRATRATALAFGALLPTKAIGSDVRPRQLLRAIGRLRSEHAKMDLGFGVLVEAVRTVSGSRSIGQGRGRQSLPSRFWDPGAIERFQMTFPASISVTLTNGESLRAHSRVPRGGAGNAEHSPTEISLEKFSTWAPRLWDDRVVASLESEIDGDGDGLAGLLV